MDIVVLALAGLLSGICASMGLGGGFLLLGYLTLFTQLSQLDAQLTNLVFFLPIAVLSVILHLKNQLIEKKVLLKAIVVGIIGVLIGGFLSGVIEEELLSKLFGGFILLIGLKEIFHRKSGKNEQKEEG